MRSHPARGALSFDLSSLAHCAAWFALALCCAAPASGVEREALHAALESITATELKEHVETLADDTFEGREAGSRGGRAAGNYLALQLEKLGLPPAGTSGYFQEYRGGRNILARIPGSDPTLADEFVLIGAHYDHVGLGTRRNSFGPWGQIHNGADDNASGTAGLLEIAGAHASLPTPPRRTILIAFWDGEEKGLLGSKHFATNATLPLTRCVLAVNLDMIGRLRNRRVEVFGTRSAPGLREFVSRANDSQLSLVFPWEMKENSDHHTFFSRGIPTLMFHTGLHDDYHRPSDDAHKISPDGIRQVAQLVFRTTLATAEADAPFRFRPASRYEGPADQRALDKTLAPLPGRFGASWSVDEGMPGVRITGLERAGAAEKAGLRVGDRLLRIDGREIGPGVPLTVQLLAAPAAPELTIVRGDTGSEETVVAPLAGRPLRIGVSWRIDPSEPQTALVVRLAYGSAAALAGVELGDRLLEVNGERFRTNEELDQLLQNAAPPIDLLLERQGQLQHALVVPME